MGLEPMTNRVTDYYSSSELYSLPPHLPLSDLNRYIHKTMDFKSIVSTNSTKWQKLVPTGIEPMLKDYESTVLPLNYGTKFSG